MDTREMKRIAIIRFSSAALVLGAFFFLSAGTTRYWQAWGYMAVTLIPMALIVHYLIRNDPELLKRRLTVREKREKQDAIQKVGAVVWLLVFLIPGLDQRFGWSSVPWLLVVISDFLVLSGYLMFFLVMKENSYASRIIEVQERQTVISTGPYALVRHPMYLTVLIMLFFSPLALGSFWAVIPTLFTPVLLVLRIWDEEKMLLKELPGYREYTQQTPHRLIPGIW
jgi:protein-S-isoprenylcysteine O-methyltransferase Ste14